MTSTLRSWPSLWLISSEGTSRTTTGTAMTITGTSMTTTAKNIPSTTKTIMMLNLSVSTPTQLGVSPATPPAPLPHSATTRQNNSHPTTIITNY